MDDDFEKEVNMSISYDDNIDDHYYTVSIVLRGQTLCAGAYRL